MIVEVGDFERCVKPEKLAAFLGVVPGEETSDEKRKRYGITKVGNSHLRRVLAEAAQAYTRGVIGHKSVALKTKTEGKHSTGNRICMRGLMTEHMDRVLENDNG